MSWDDDDASPVWVDLDKEALNDLLNDIQKNNVIQMMCDEIKTLNYDTGLPEGINDDVSDYILRMRRLIYPTTPRQWKTEQDLDLLDGNGYFSQYTVFLALTGYDNIALRDSSAIMNVLHGHESNIFIVFDVNHFYALFDCKDPLMRTAYQNVFGDCENDDRYQYIYDSFPDVKIPGVRHGGDCGPQSMIYAMMVEREYRRLQEEPKEEPPAKETPVKEEPPAKEEPKEEPPAKDASPTKEELKEEPKEEPPVKSRLQQKMEAKAQAEIQKRKEAEQKAGKSKKTRKLRRKTMKSKKIMKSKKTMKYKKTKKSKK